MELSELSRTMVRQSAFTLFLRISLSALVFFGFFLNADELYGKVRATSNRIASKLKKKAKKPRSVSDVIASVGPSCRKTWKKRFKRAKIEYPPRKLLLIGLKDEEKLLILAGESEDGLKKVVEYPILGNSGTTGPKLEEGDFQMPEGFYRISAFNPNSSYHLSLRIDYPNEEDRRHGREDGRKKLGGDIMIHGKDCSIGCLAMGDEAIEEIFTLVHDTGRSSTRVILSPCDLTSRKPVIDMKKQPKWVPDLYRRLKKELSTYLGAPSA